MTFQIGQTLPAVRVRGIVHGPEIDPVWHCLLVRSGSESRTERNLQLRGVTAFYPSKEVTRVNRGIKYKRTMPLVSGFVYAQFRQAPQWDNMKRREGFIIGVFSVKSQPIVIHPDVIRRLRGMTVEEERLRLAQAAMERARVEALRPKPGEVADWTDGPLQGFAVNVESIKNGEVIFSFLTGGRGKTTIDMLARRG